jgi:predicted metalloprotease with PDZ domain
LIHPTIYEALRNFALMTMHYDLSVADPHTHFFQVGMTLPTTPGRLVLRLPAWIPGSYMVRDFAKHVRNLGAWSRQGTRRRRLSVRELDKDSWEVVTQGLAEGSPVDIEYEVYAFDRSVRCAYLDQERGFFNASSLLLYCPERLEAACELTIHRPTGMTSVQLATGLRQKKCDRHGFGLYAAKNYDELIDCPVEIAKFDEFTFEAGGATHRFVITGSPAQADLDRLRQEVQAICTTQCAFFEPKTGRAPFSNYVFMLNVLGAGYGGLEHRNSTALICSRSDFDVGSDGYRTLLGLISHEYFHSWNVKRIKPAAFVPYQLQHENYTRLLWIFEGFTSYYDDLLAFRSGVFTESEYLAALGKTLTQVANSAGRPHQTVEASSFYAWNKYYKQDENSPNSIVSYYTLGATVALCLDLQIRRQTKNRRSLDDVMRILWTRFGREFEHAPRGLGEDEFADVVQQACALDLRGDIALWTQSTSELPLQELLAAHGLALEQQALDTLDSLLGAKLRSSGQGLECTHVRAGAAAENAGLAAGDVLVAANRIKATESGLLRALRTLAGDAPHKIKTRATTSISLLVFRSDVLLELTLKRSSQRSQSVNLVQLVRPTAAQRQAQRAWLRTSPSASSPR